MYDNETRWQRVLQATESLEKYEAIINNRVYSVRMKRYLDSVQIKYYQVIEENSMMDSVRSDEIEKEQKTDEEKEMESIYHSRSRTINAIYDYGKSNRWEWWCTFTFNPNKVDRYNFSECSKKMSNWLHVIRKKNSNLKYLIVPEMHKDGAWHFHGLFSNVDGIEFVNSGHNFKNQVVYNIANFKWGFTHAIHTDGSMKVVSYLTKYISKDLCCATKGKKRYWISKNLDTPQIIDYNTRESFDEVVSMFDLNGAYFKTIEGYNIETTSSKLSLVL